MPHDQALGEDPVASLAAGGCRLRLPRPEGYAAGMGRDVGTAGSGVPRVGIIGGGQLARMTAQAAIGLGVGLRVMAERPDDGAATVVPADRLDIGAPGDESALRRFLAGNDVTTFDHELVDVAVLSRLAAEGHAFLPRPATMALGQDKRRQREVLSRLGLPCPPSAPVERLADAVAFGDRHGWPGILKASRGGYDGRGVWVVDDAAAASVLVPDLLAAGVPLLIEELVALDREVATLVARRPSGQVVAYPVVETVQREGICRRIIAPERVDAGLAVRLVGWSHHLAEEIDLVGIMAVEWFVVGDEALVNEIAVRTHNSGHYTIEGSVTSQFAQHLRAILDWPLGETALTAPVVVTVNVLGAAGVTTPLAARMPAALAVPGVHVHLYGKTPRPGRKLGHVTALGTDVDEVSTRAQMAADALAGACEAGWNGQDGIEHG